MKTEYITLKEAVITNNCPECYSTDSMVLSFKQQRVKTKLLTKTKANIVESLNCNKCESQIFPGQWTTDIERVYNYHKKTISHISSTMHFSNLSYVLLAIFLLIIASATYFFISI